MSINLRLLFRNLKTLFITIIIVQILSVGIYHVYSYFFDDYVSEAKIVSSCFDSANSCELVGDVSNIKNLADYVHDKEILEEIVNDIETSTGTYLSVMDIKSSITVHSREGYLSLKISSNDSYLANEIYEHLIYEVFNEANANQTRYIVVDYSLYEVISKSFVQQMGAIIGVFIAFIIIFNSTKKGLNNYLSLLGGITLAKNKVKQNLLITIVTIAIFIALATGVYFGHKSLFKSYQIETKYTFVCDDPSTCDFDNVNELYNALKSNTSKNSTVTSIIETVSRTSQIHLSNEDVEQSFELNLSNDVIVLVVKNKDTLTATYIHDAITNIVFNNIEIQENIQLRQLDSDFKEMPNVNTYLFVSTSLGLVTVLLLIGSELNFKKSKNNKKTP